MGKMTLHIVQLGSPRSPAEGLRIGTVRRPPRGVPKSRYSSDNWYDVWLPELAPSDALVKRALAAETRKDWNAFVKRYRAEMKRPEKVRLLKLLALLSQEANLSVGCYCEDESRCHRSVLRELLKENGARLA